MAEASIGPQLVTGCTRFFETEFANASGLPVSTAHHSGGPRLRFPPKLTTSYPQIFRRVDQDVDAIFTVGKACAGKRQERSLRFILSFPDIENLPSRTCETGVKNPSRGRGKYRCLITGVNAPKPSHLPKFARPEDFAASRNRPSAGQVQSADDALQIPPALRLVLGLAQQKCRVVSDDYWDVFVKVRLPSESLQ